MSTAKQIRIMIVEDHPVFREGLDMIITAQQDMVTVAQASTADLRRPLIGRRDMP